MSKKVQDTIRLTLSAEETVVNDTVKVIATIVGMIPDDMDEKKLRDSVRLLVKKFIDTDWQFSNMVRSSHASGKEQITLMATTRIPEKENYALDRRREDASRNHDLMRITTASTDTAPTNGQIEETQRKLRVAILKKAQDELQLLNETLDAEYRLGDVSFSIGFDAAASNTRVASSAALLGGSKVAYGSSFDAADDTLGNAVKLTMQASIEYRIGR